MLDTSSESALARPFRTIFRFVGGFIDAVYYFVDSLFNPGRGTYNRGRLTDSRGSGGGCPRVRTLRPDGESRGNAPNMSIGGCRSCM